MPSAISDDCCCVSAVQPISNLGFSSNLFCQSMSRQAVLRCSMHGTAKKRISIDVNAILFSILFFRHEPVARKVLSTRAYEEPCWHYKRRKTFLATDSSLTSSATGDMMAAR